jgi:hypothetical protein
MFVCLIASEGREEQEQNQSSGHIEEGPPVPRIVHVDPGQVHFRRPPCAESPVFANDADQRQQKAEDKNRRQQDKSDHPHVRFRRRGERFQKHQKEHEPETHRSDGAAGKGQRIVK